MSIQASPFGLPRPLSQQAAERAAERSDPDSDSGRPQRRRTGGALGYAVAALHDALGPDVPLEVGAAKVTLLQR